ncbi:crotonase [Marinifilum sp. N1E240]|uniref:enoyl-CoA hydratase/isomerase family protein n=1 Tax=Marinifilum sp. N1E240 TaxID=2608082 RepID=UPI00128C0975|nr:enoyl-CoA hydratase-related protein [Marinifilum sp. N1E240]MPQ48350.1 crotonase [Marinifilum sp. N1E240]|eukprot:TRINITY_DN2920_c0_g1_i1.p1 TRINITY_DN2920_c0_g1~~TRINITY_DN2920_c0_g1_i1.p1  ORF type:complete len:259 (+),score=48.51 TRINITY_DN2920_c0_g1_i1:32-808(+)
MEFNYLKFEKRGRIGILTLDRPKALNALNEGVFKELTCFLESEDVKSTRALVITGEGKAFIAGADIKAMQEYSPQAAYDFSETGKMVFDKIANLEVPVIAAINGFALGGGLELALACDIRVASEKARLGLPEVNLGLIPGFNGTQRLPRLVGAGNAMYLMMLGEGITATEAYQLGIVQKLTPPESTLDEAVALAEKIVTKGPNALRLIKEMVREGLELNSKEAGKMESKEFGRLFKEDHLEREEGINAFLEKRHPNWE